MSNGLTKEHILRSFSTEEDQSKTTLDVYLRRYPQFATALVELSLELEMMSVTTPDSSTDLASKNSETSQVEAALSGDRAKVLAKKLGFRRAFVAAFRDRTLSPETLPQSLVRKTAAAASVGKADLLTYLCMPPRLSSNLSMKSLGKPGEPEKMSLTDFIADLDLDDAEKAQLYDGGFSNGPD